MAVSRGGDLLANNPRGDLQVSEIRLDLGEFRLEADFRVASGERAALIGRSGSGKTTLLRVLAGLESLPPGSGRIYLGGEEITRLPVRARGIGLVFQDAALFPALNVLENAVFGLKVRGEAKKRAEALGLEWLERVGMKALARVPIHRLSGGERSRVAFVRALIWRPRLVLLDEPFSALDAELRTALRSELVELHRLWPAPLVLVSHDREDLQAVANVTLELRQAAGSAVRRVERMEKMERVESGTLDRGSHLPIDERSGDS